jgi:hypothetical protein
MTNVPCDLAHSLDYGNHCIHVYAVLHTMLINTLPGCNIKGDLGRMCMLYLACSSINFIIHVNAC